MEKFAFYAIFSTFYVFGGTAVMLGFLPNKWSYMAVFPLLLIPKYMKKIRIDIVTFAILMLSMVIIISGIINNSSPLQILKFLRYVIYPYLIYFLVDNYVTSKNIEKIIKLAIFIGVIQLPVLIIQNLFYGKLIKYSVISIRDIDFNYGTFWVQNDAGLCVFLLSLIIFLLFEINYNYFIKKRMFLSIYFSLSILLTNSRLSFLILFLVWGVYLIRNRNLGNILKISIGFSTILTVMLYFGFHKHIQSQVKLSWDRVTLINPGTEKLFLQGSYSRGAGVQYFLRQPLKIFGDGPLKYSNPIRKMTLGLYGQLLIFYAEIGIVGLIAGYFLLFSIGKKKSSSGSKVYLFYFVLLSLITLVICPLTDLGILLIYNIMLRANLIKHRGTVAVLT